MLGGGEHEGLAPGGRKRAAATRLRCQPLPPAVGIRSVWREEQALGTARGRSRGLSGTNVGFGEHIVRYREISDVSGMSGQFGALLRGGLLEQRREALLESVQLGPAEGSKENVLDNDSRDLRDI